MSTSQPTKFNFSSAPATPRIWLGSFLVLGVLLGLLGSLMVAWQYQIDVEPQLIGLHFLALNAGYVIAAEAAQKILRQSSPKNLAAASCSLACGSFIAMVFAAPPAPFIWRLLLLGATGLGAGGLGTSLMYAFQPHFERAPAQAVNKAGALFGLGCLLATITVGLVYVAGWGPIQTAILTAIPLFFLCCFLTLRPSTTHKEPLVQEREKLRETLRDLRSIAPVLLSLLLFFQFGNEWAIAGWLPLFLIHRLGTNPALAISVLGVYFLTLLLGRMVAQKLLPPSNHRRFLIAAVALGMCGMLLLSYTNSLTYATVAVIIIGVGFAPIYPLVAERLDDRFSYHPGFYNGITSVAITGALSAPWLLGYVDAFLGMRYVMILPAFGSIVVLLLSLLLMFEAHLMGDTAGISGRFRT